MYTVRVNKDDIRRGFEANGWVWSTAAEKDVVAYQDQQIRLAFKSGADCVIVDDTNFGRKHRVRLAALAFECDAEFEIKRFDTPIEECIRRDAFRVGKAQVGEVVIRQMAARYGILGPEPALVRVEPDEYLASAIICDLDGTLALFAGQRSPYDHGQCANDRVNEPIKNIIEVYYRFMNWQIIYLTGREEKFREPTDEFRRRHHCPPGPMFMRATGDHRKDWIVKSELFDAHVRGKYRVRFVLDDRNQVVDMWRKLGLTCLQVADGAF